MPVVNRNDGTDHHVSTKLIPASDRASSEAVKDLPSIIPCVLIDY